MEQVFVVFGRLVHETKTKIFRQMSFKHVKHTVQQTHGNRAIFSSDFDSPWNARTWEFGGEVKFSLDRLDMDRLQTSPSMHHFAIPAGPSPTAEWFLFLPQSFHNSSTASCRGCSDFGGFVETKHQEDTEDTKIPSVQQWQELSILQSIPDRMWIYSSKPEWHLNIFYEFLWIPVQKCTKNVNLLKPVAVAAYGIATDSHQLQVAVTRSAAQRGDAWRGELSVTLEDVSCIHSAYIQYIYIYTIYIYTIYIYTIYIYIHKIIQMKTEDLCWVSSVCWLCSHFAAWFMKLFLLRSMGGNQRRCSDPKRDKGIGPTGILGYILVMVKIVDQYCRSKNDSHGNKWYIVITVMKGFWRELTWMRNDVLFVNEFWVKDSRRTNTSGLAFETSRWFLWSQFQQFIFSTLQILSPLT